MCFRHQACRTWHQHHDAASGTVYLLLVLEVVVLEKKWKTVFLLNPAMTAKRMATRRKVSEEDTLQTSHWKELVWPVWMWISR